jgi:type I restriction enzyme, S subunit
VITQLDRLRSNVSPGWKRTTLGAIGKYLNGRGFKKSEWGFAGLPIVRIQDLTGTGQERHYFDGEIDERHVINPGDLLISWAPTLGAFVWKGPKAALNQHIFKVDSYINKRLHYYLIRHILDELYRQTHGSGMVHITKDKFEATPIEIPNSGGQQEQIVAEIEKQFSRLDEAVANLKRVKANLKRYKASVPKAAVEGKLSEDWRKQHPNVEPASKLLERILVERRIKWNGRGKYKEPAKPDTNNLPLLPEKWTWASVDQLTSHITSGSRDWTRYYGRGSGTFILAQNVRLMRLDMRERQSVDPPKSDAETARTRVSIGDLLVTIVGAKTGEVCRITMELVEHFVCQSVALLRPLMPASARFMELYLASPENGQAQWKQYIYGQGRPHLSFEQLKMTAIALPPLTEQHEVLAEVERRLSVIDELELAVDANLTRAVRLRQSTLAAAFSDRLLSRQGNALYYRNS